MNDKQSKNMPLNVAVIGLGSMGLGMANNIQKNWGSVYGFDINDKSLENARGCGINSFNSYEDFDDGHFDVAIIMVVNDSQAETVLFGARFINKVKEGGIVVLTSTLSQDFVFKTDKRLNEIGISLIDAPVSGGAVGANDGTLAIFASGHEGVFNVIKPILEACSKNLFYISKEIGAGTAVKIVHQLIAGVHLAAMGEAMALAEACDIPLDMMHEVVKVSSGYSFLFDNRAPRIVNNDYKPRGTVDVFVKDLNLVLDVARQHRFPLPLTGIAHSMFSTVSRSGYGGLDDAAIVGYFPNFNLSHMSHSVTK